MLVLLLHLDTGAVSQILATGKGIVTDVGTSWFDFTEEDYNPVFFSYVLFFPETKTVNLYIDGEKVEAIKSYLEGINVTILPYE